MLFANGAMGLALDTERLCLKVVEGDDPSVTHDPKNKGIAAMLIEMPQSFPVALGVIYEDPAPTLSPRSNRTRPPHRASSEPPGTGSKGQTWMVEKEPHKL
jgi:2-oxoglutarate ferredoxin oxidoreductase subunit beta